jgi:hypothetical protein
MSANLPRAAIDYDPSEMTAKGTLRKSSWVSETATSAPKQSFLVEQLLATFGTFRSLNLRRKWQVVGMPGG